MQRLTQRVAARIPEDPEGFWLERLDVDTRAANKSHFEGRLRVADILEVLQAADFRYSSMILFKWQSFADNERLIYANRYCGQ